MISEMSARQFKQVACADRSSFTGFVPSDQDFSGRKSGEYKAK